MAEIDFILASASPRRRELCQSAGYRFDVQVSAVNEPPFDHFATPEAYASHTAWLKANAVARPTGPWVLAADTVVALGSILLGKPNDRADAECILKMLMGTRHHVITGICLVVPEHGIALVDHVTTTVEMRPLSTKELDDYLESNLWEGKAGAYGIQDGNDPFVTALEGSFSNVVGLPMERVAEILILARAWKEIPLPPQGSAGPSG